MWALSSTALWFPLVIFGVAVVGVLWLLWTLWTWQDDLDRLEDCRDP